MTTLYNKAVNKLEIMYNKLIQAVKDGNEIKIRAARGQIVGALKMLLSMDIIDQGQYVSMEWLMEDIHDGDCTVVTNITIKQWLQ